MNKKAQTNQNIVKELVVGFGFLEGIWIAAGVNPEGEVINAFIQSLQSLEAPASYIFIMKILPIISLIATLIWIYKLVGKLGFIAIAFAFLGGCLLIKFTFSALILLIIGLVIGANVFPETE